MATENGHDTDTPIDEDQAVDECFATVRAVRTELIPINAARKAAYRRIADAYATLKQTTGISRRRAELVLEIKEIEEEEERTQAFGELQRLCHRELAKLKPGETLDWERMANGDDAHA